MILAARIQSLKQVLFELAEEVERLTLGLGEQPDFADVVEALRHLSGCRRYLKESEELVSELAAALAPSRVTTVEGVGPVTKYGATVTRSEWENEAIWPRVVARARDERRMDPETGEALESETEAVIRVLKDVMSPTWKVGARDGSSGLRRLGLDPDEFCKTGKSRPNVSIPATAKIDLDMERQAPVA